VFWKYGRDCMALGISLRLKRFGERMVYGGIGLTGTGI
jgi:hypothetical protein